FIPSTDAIQPPKEMNMTTATLHTSIARDLTGRIAVVTGASSGMGRATALLLASRGAKIALLARRKAALDDIAAEIQGRGGSALALVTDVTDQASVETAAAAIRDQYGNADLVFNN